MDYFKFPDWIELPDLYTFTYIMPIMKEIDNDTFIESPFTVMVLDLPINLN